MVETAMVETAMVETAMAAAKGKAEAEAEAHTCASLAEEAAVAGRASGRSSSPG
jgi:hypothetical protein